MTISDVLRWIGNLSAWWLVPVAVVWLWHLLASAGHDTPTIDADEIADAVENRLRPDLDDLEHDI